MLKSLFKKVESFRPILKTICEWLLLQLISTLAEYYHIWFVSFSPTFFRVFYYVQIYPEKNRDRVTQTPQLYREHIYN